jgi:hypothetical protein
MSNAWAVGPHQAAERWEASSDNNLKRAYLVDEALIECLLRIVRRKGDGNAPTPGGIVNFVYPNLLMAVGVILDAPAQDSHRVVPRGPGHTRRRVDKYNILICPTTAVPSVKAEHRNDDPDFAINGKKVPAYVQWILTLSIQHDEPMPGRKRSKRSIQPGNTHGTSDRRTNLR